MINRNMLYMDSRPTMLRKKGITRPKKRKAIRTIFIIASWLTILEKFSACINNKI